ncbi:hypothetical protein SAMN05421823_104339 [Catalinimonas alkaloidigena]|uniref:Pirin family protein n=1 Tax=Catalinimonas alkaloidigena TaxID=1075417 RepID=A0A1G9H6X6_9BACT|nr:pirin family protein [Catalinimonas alkaloidigena]SDL08711.1 hypothetical protein SAMN05421823_104339 [Catalinimonas alkaloidigena]
MRSFKKIHDAEYRPIADLVTYSPLPTMSLEMIDPFLFLNHHGPQTYPSHNRGLPFGPHPHRGMETVTFILDGDIMHKDSGGHESVINAGGVQWMTAGKGLIHAEVSSDQFKKQGGPLEILQLWLNLPAKLKMVKPRYIGLQADQIPHIPLANGSITLNLVAGAWEGQVGAFDPTTELFLSTIDFKKLSELTLRVPTDHNVFFYVIRGKLLVNQQNVEACQLVEFENDAEEIHVQALDESILLFGHARPFNEPVVAQGPFVMNTEAEIMEAYQDYRQGKFGTWQ